MRILIVSNLYPPHYKGGYELRCAQVAEALAESGHQLVVLTSVYGLSPGELRRLRGPEHANGVTVLRWLHQHAYGPHPGGRPWTLFEARRRFEDARRFRLLLDGFRPNVVSWWSMNGISKTLLPLPERYGIPDVHWIEHPWMIHEYGPEGERESMFWEALRSGRWGPAPLRPVTAFVGEKLESRAVRRGLTTRQFPNQPVHVCFVSEYLRDLYRKAGFDFASSEVIYGGVHADRFYHTIDGRGEATGPLRLLYAGQLSSDRGLHTVIEAMARLSTSIPRSVRLTVAGDGPADYIGFVRQRIETHGLGDRVEFVGRLPHEAMPELHQSHDVLVFPSSRPEGLPLTMVEAMMAGCAVVTTGAGGAREVAAAADLPVFPQEDPAALARLLEKLVTNPAALRRLAAHGQSVALREFRFEQMMGRVQSMLDRVANARRPGAPHTLVPAPDGGGVAQVRPDQ